MLAPAHECRCSWRTTAARCRASEGCRNCPRAARSGRRGRSRPGLSAGPQTSIPSTCLGALDLLDWLLGPVEHVSGIAANQGGHYEAEDVVAGVFEFTSGVRGVGLWSF